MGRIPEYERGQLASSYIGGAQRDDSGALITQAVGETISPIVSNEIKKQAAITEFHFEQQANGAIVEASLAAQQTVKDLQKQYADNPEKLSAAVNEALEKQSTEYLKAIPNDKVNMKVQAGLTQLRRAIMPTVADIATKQRESITQATIQTASETVITACATANNVLDYKANLQAIHNIYFPDMESIPEERRAEVLQRIGLNPEVRDKMYKEALGRAANAFINYRIAEDPVGALKILRSSEFNKMTVETAEGEMQIPFSAEDKLKYEKMAKEYEGTMQKRRDSEILMTSTGENFDFYRQYRAGDVSLGDILTRTQLMKRDPNAPESSKRFMNALARVAVRENNDTDQADPLIMGQLYARYDRLSSEMNAKKGRSKKKQFDKDPQKFLEPLTELYVDTLDALGNDQMRYKDADTLTQKLLKGMYDSIRTGKDIDGDHRVAYKDISQSVKNNTSLAGDDRTLATVQAFTDYLRRVQDYDDRGVILKPEDSRRLAKEAYNETLKTYFPALRASMTDDAPNAIASEKTGADIKHTTVNGMKADGRLTQGRPKKGAKQQFNGKWYVAGDNGWIEL